MESLTLASQAGDDGIWGVFLGFFLLGRVGKFL